MYSTSADPSRSRRRQLIDSTASHEKRGDIIHYMYATVIIELRIMLRQLESDPSKVHQSNAER